MFINHTQNPIFYWKVVLEILANSRALPANFGMLQNSFFFFFTVRISSKSELTKFEWKQAAEITAFLRMVIHLVGVK